MSDLSEEFKSNLANLYKNNQYSQLEFEIEKLGELDKLPKNILYLYSISIGLNPLSSDERLKISSKLLKKIYLEDKTNLEPLYNLAVISLKSGLYLDILELLSDALKLYPKDERIIEFIAKFNFVLSNLKESIKYYELLFELSPRKLEARISYLICLNYIPGISQEKYFQESKKISEIIEKEMKFDFVKDRNLKTKISLGFLSSDFKRHSVSFFLKDFLKNIDQNKFELTAFSNLSEVNHDDITRKLKKTFNHWYDIFNIPDENLVKFIREKKIDILIDLNGFTFGNRSKVISKRVANLQISWLGYCNTTGLTNMDYLFTDKNCIKHDEEKFYSENILYLPNIWNVMSKPDELPDVNDLPRLKKDIFTFGCFNNFQKISDDVVHVWSQIINKSNSRIILKNSINDNEDINKNLIKKFKKNNINTDKIIFYKYFQNQKNHLELYNQIDVALDTFPYNGVTTSFEANLMGVPVLTMKGNNFNSRCGESISKNSGAHFFLCENKNEYIEKAINLSKDFNFLSQNRKQLRDKILASPLFDMKDFCKNFTKLLVQIYDNTI